MVIELYKGSIYDNGVPLFRDVSFQACPGEIVAVTANRIEPMTALLHSLAGMRALDSGWANVGGEPIVKPLAAYFRRQMSCVPRNVDFGDITVSDVFGMFCNMRVNTGMQGHKDMLKECLSGLHVSDSSIDKPFSALQPSEAQRVAIAVAAVCAHPIMLLDEPVAYQSDSEVALVSDFLHSPRFKDVAIVLTTQNRLLLSRCTNTVMLDSDGFSDMYV